MWMCVHTHSNFVEYFRKSKSKWNRQILWAAVSAASVLDIFFSPNLCNPLKTCPYFLLGAYNTGVCGWPPHPTEEKKKKKKKCMEHISEGLKGPQSSQQELEWEER